MKRSCISFMSILLFTIVTQNVPVFSSKILFFHTFVTSSHRTAIWPLAEKLADLGHNITYIFPMEKRIGHHPKIEEIIPSKMLKIMSKTVAEFDINIRLENRVNEWLESVLDTTVEMCEAFFESPEVEQWLNKPGLSYDLILIDAALGECGFSLVHKFKAKYIQFTPIMTPFMYDGLGFVPESSSNPDVLFHAKPTQMTLLNRMKTTLTYLLWRFKFLQYMTGLEEIFKQKASLISPNENFPSIIDIERNVSLIMINNYLIEEYPISLPPLFVSFSGLWCSRDKLKERKPLPAEMETFLGKSEAFFYVSFGSSTVVSAMPVEMRERFFDAFRAFPQVKFFWRWTGSKPANTPSNVMLKSWFPQQDILAHPKIKGFLMQGGRPSTTEALCFGVPLITMPIFGDQDFNADRMEYLGAGISLDINNLTVDSLREAFKELLENPKRKERMLELSAIFKDRPVDPLDNAVFWTEYVLRHDTSILRPLGITQTWYQRRLLDVYAAFVAIIATFVGVTVVLLCFCLKRVVSKKSKLKTN